MVMVLLVVGGGGWWVVGPTPISAMEMKCPVIPLVHWKGFALSRQRSVRTLKTLSNLSAVKRFLGLFWFDRFGFNSRDFVNQVFRNCFNRGFSRFLEAQPPYT